jgi:hypothetical protein
VKIVKTVVHQLQARQRPSYDEREGDVQVGEERGAEEDSEVGVEPCARRAESTESGNV